MNQQPQAQSKPNQPPASEVTKDERIMAVRFVHSVPFDGAELETATSEVGAAGLASAGYRGIRIEPATLGGAHGVSLSRRGKRIFVPTHNLKCIVLSDE